MLNTVIDCLHANEQQTREQKLNAWTKEAKKKHANCNKKKFDAEAATR